MPVHLGFLLVDWSIASRAAISGPIVSQVTIGSRHDPPSRAGAPGAIPPARTEETTMKLAALDHAFETLLVQEPEATSCRSR